jgi:hypothetical protein
MVRRATVYGMACVVFGLWAGATVKDCVDAIQSIAVFTRRKYKRYWWVITAGTEYECVMTL